jgi:hypothetical protein
MISVLIRVEHGVEALAATLNALVPAVADGLIADAVVMSRRDDPAIAGVADAVGAMFVVEADDSWIPGAEAAKRDWILCLKDGDVPSEGWIRALDRFIAMSPPQGRFGRLSRRPATPAARLKAIVPALLGRDEVRAGDLVHKSLLRGAAAPRPARVQAVIERDPVFG